MGNNNRSISIITINDRPMTSKYPIVNYTSLKNLDVIKNVKVMKTMNDIKIINITAEMSIKKLSGNILISMSTS